MRIKDIISFLIIILFLTFFGLTLYSIFTIENQPTIYYVQWLPGKLLATTIPPVGIFIKDKYIIEGEAKGSILAHEKIHWLQYQQLGLWNFYVKYYTGLIKYGRFKAPMEVDARARSL